MSEWVDCTGDVCTGDTIRFTEAVFGGSRRSPTYLGDRTITAKVVSDSYGSAKQQHTFSLVVLECDGLQPLPPGTKTTRKGRNVYRNGTLRLLWADENERTSALAEKHARGSRSRAKREARQARSW